MALVTLAQAKQQLGISSDYTDDDDELTDYVDAIAATVEAYKDEVVEQRQVTELRDLRGGSTFILASRPVSALTSIVRVDGSASYDPDSLDVDPSGVVTVLAGQPAPCGRCRITYTAGYDQPPNNYVRGALVILQHVWETQRGTAGGVTGVATADDGVFDPRFSYSIPRKALEWLGAPGCGVA